MLISKLNVILNSLDPGDANYTISRYIKINIDRMDDIGIKEIAAECYMSQGTISKFCKRIGYESFSELKEDCKNYARERKRYLTQYQGSAAEQTYPIAFAKRMQLMQNGILKSLDQQKMNRLIKDLRNAHCVFLYGEDYHQVTCRHLQYYFDCMGITVVVIDEDIVKNYRIKDNSVMLIFDEDGRFYNSRKKHRVYQNQAEKWFITNRVIPKEHTLLVVTDQTALGYKFIADLIIAGLLQSNE